MTHSGQFAIVTGASSGIGFHLAECCAKDGYDLLLVADEAAVEQAVERCRSFGVNAAGLVADLSTIEGVDALLAASGGRAVDALLANAGQGLGRAFLDQDFGDIRKVVDTNIVGTLYLLHKVGATMRSRGEGRILITGSIAGFMPGTFQAVYNGTKAFIDSFSHALRHELKDTKVTVTCLMPGATDTEFFDRADMKDTKVGTAKKDDAAKVAQDGYEAMQSGESQVISGWKNKLQSAVAHVIPAAATAEVHRSMAEPGTAS